MLPQPWNPSIVRLLINSSSSVVNSFWACSLISFRGNALCLNGSCSTNCLKFSSEISLTFFWKITKLFERFFDRLATKLRFVRAVVSFTSAEDRPRSEEHTSELQSRGHL